MKDINRLPQLFGQSTDIFTIFRNTFRLLALVWEAVPLWIVFSVALTLGNALVPVAQLYISKLIVDRVVILIQSGESAQFTHHLLGLVAIGFSLTLLGSLLQQSSNYVARIVEDKFVLYANIRLLKQAMHLDLAHYESSEFHDILNRAQQSGSQYPMRVMRLLTSLLGQLTRFGGLLTLLLRFSPWVMLLLLFSTLPTFGMGVRYSYRRFWMNRRQTQSRRLADYFGEVLTNAKYVKEVRLFNLGDYLALQYRTIREEFNQESRQLAKQQSLAQLAIEVMSNMGFYGAYGLVLQQALLGKITIGDLTLYVGAFQQAQSAIAAILSSIALMYEYNLYVSQYFEFLDLRPILLSPRFPHPFPHPMQQGIVLEDVSFAYPGANQPTLQGINLQVKPGECIALVGLNGSGKTTLLKLISRLYDIDQGSISIDGVNLADFDLCDLRQNIGVLFQDFAQYALTVEDNIGFGNLAHRNNDTRIHQAASDAGATTIVDALEQRYKTVLGKMFAGGVDLSGGQWQKIGLARAFMSDAQILILDEPTAAVDAIAEYELFQRFRQLTKGKMTFLVSHRFSTVRMADRIIVLDKGQIVEVGSHGQLMKCHGLYQQMFEMQAESYTSNNPAGK
ncbi:MAG: ABC transporter ATP-binding protein [Cyanobacteria bacterium P01_F01_bin.150]